MSIRKISLEEFHQELKAQGVESRDYAFICPMCMTIQSARDFIKIGMKSEEIEKQLGFSCIGRYLDADPPREEPDGKPCNWTLGGLFHLHTLEVITEDGKAQPCFELATPTQAQNTP